MPRVLQEETKRVWRAEMRAFWLRAFKRRPDVPWPDFWACFPRDLATPAAAELRMMFLPQSARDALQAR